MNVSNILKNSLLYIGFDVLVKLLPFFLVFILTHYLSPEDMGIIAEFTALTGMLSVFCGLSTQEAISVAFVKIGTEAIATYVFNVLVILITASLLVILLVGLLTDVITNYVSLTKHWLFFASLTASAQLIIIINTTLWQMEKQPLPYGFFQMAYVTSIFLLSLVLIIGLEFTWQGRLIAQILATTAFSLLSIWILYKRHYLTPKINTLFIKDALKFGIPLIPHTLAGWFFMGFSIMLISAKLGKESAGIFSVALQFAIAMSITIDSVNRSITPYFYEQLNNLQAQNKRKLVNFTYLFFLAVGIIGLIIWQMALLAIMWVIDEQFQSARFIVGYLIVGYMLNGLYYFLGRFITYQRKNYLITAITLFSAIVHVAFASLLANYYGLVGVAFTSVLSGLTMFCMVWFIVNRVTPMPWFSFLKKLGFIYR